MKRFPILKPPPNLTRVIFGQPSPMFTFGNNAALDMPKTMLVNPQGFRVLDRLVLLEAILDDKGRKALCAEFSKVMQQVMNKPTS